MLRIKRLVTLTVIVYLSSISYANAHDFDTPEQVIDAYMTAVKTGSGEHIVMAFTESASIQYYDHEGKYQNYTRDAFSKLVNTGNQWDAKIEITDMKKVGKVANATVEFTWGKNGEKGYVDYLNLVHDGKSWHISDKVAQFIER